MPGEHEAGTGAGAPPSPSELIGLPGSGERRPRTRSLRIAGTSYPVVLPSWKDPRLHVSATFVLLHALGQTEFHFGLSFPQIASAILTCALIEAVVTFWRRRVILWPASALLTGNGIAFILRVPGTRHGDWWTFHGVWVYAAVGAVAMASKYLIHFRGRHVFNPANVALVLGFLILGSGRADPLQFWWGPLSPALVIALLVIVAGAFVVLSRVGLLAVALLFWVTFAGALGILALSGHAFSANWHLGPVADGYFWKVLITSPEVFIFLAFMITDPRTAPETARGRRVYAIAIGLLGALLIAPMQTEFWAKVALLGALTIVCAARPFLILAKEAIERRQRSRQLRRQTVCATAGPCSASSPSSAPRASRPSSSWPAAPPARSPRSRVGSLGSAVPVEIAHTTGVVSITPQTGRQIAAGAIADLRRVAIALGRRDAARATGAAGGAYLSELKARIAAAAGRPIVVPSYRVASVDLRLQLAVGQAPPTVVATLTGEMTPLTYPVGSSTAQSGTARSFTHVFDLALTGGRLLIIGEGAAAAPPAAVPASPAANANLSKGIGALHDSFASSTSRRSSGSTSARTRSATR